MLNAPEPSPLSTRIDHLITLLERVLEKEHASATDRLDQLLSDLSRIDCSMSKIADTMGKIVPHMSDRVSTQKFEEFEVHLTAALQIIIDRQKGLKSDLANWHAATPNAGMKD